MLNINKIMYFENDDDFTSFCINPELKIYTITDENGIEKMYADYDFSDAYKNAIDSGVRFCIKDINSRVNKNGDLGYRNTTKTIDNIERYYGEC